jgi:hypothetical protein
MTSQNLTSEMARRFQEESGGLLHIELRAAGDLDNPDYMIAVLDWIAAVPRDEPVCMSCERPWLRPDPEAPACYAFIEAVHKTSDQYGLLTAGICLRCTLRPDLKERVAKAIESTFPGAKVVEAPPAPSKGGGL